jgi:probable F420-dependent oxidoreductase
VKYELQLYPYGRWGSLQEIGRVTCSAEQLGFSTVLVPTHFHVPKKQADIIGGVWYDQTVVASYLAGVTSKINVHFAALIIPYINPVQMARILATIDQLSQGRTSMTIGSGWMQEEFDALGLPSHERGPITDEYMAVMRGLWTGNEFGHKGKYVSFESAVMDPVCVQRPHLPIWIGGSGPAARRRMAEYGAGWTPLYGSLAQLATEIDIMKAAVADRGRDPEALGFGFHMAYGERDPEHDAAAAKASTPDDGLWGATSDKAVEQLHAASEAGLTHMEITSGWRTPDHLIEILHQFHDEVMPHVRRT